jgi:hypothetical protein
MRFAQQAEVAVYYGIIGTAILIVAQYSYYLSENDTSGLPLLLGIATVFMLPFLLIIYRTYKPLAPIAYHASRWRYMPLRWAWLGFGIAWMFVTFLLAGDGLLTRTLFIMWMTGIVYWWFLLGGRVRWHTLTVKLNGHTLAVLTILGIGAFALFFRLNTVPYEMIPDHRLKMLDVLAISEGDTRLYYMLSFGREPLHFYLSYGLSLAFGVSFLTLKFAGALMSWLTLIAAYALGRTIGGKRLGLITLILMSSSLWLLIGGRSGFRVTTSLLPTTLYILFLWRAFHHGRRLDFLLAGLVLGVALYTYYATRALPAIAIGGFVMCWLLAPRRERWPLTLNFAALVLMALMVYMPLLSFWFNSPDDYWLRADGLSQGFDIGGIISSFIETMLVFNMPLDPYPANHPYYWGSTGPIIAALWPIGLLLWVVATIKTRRWMNLFLLIAFAVMLLPSAIASNAVDTPSTRRVLAAFTLVTFFAAFTIEQIFILLQHSEKTCLAGWTSNGFVFALLIASLIINWNMYFVDFAKQVRTFGVNPRDVAATYDAFVHGGGQPDDAYILFNHTIWTDPDQVQAWIDPAIWTFPILVELNSVTCNYINDGDPQLFIYPPTQTIRPWLDRCFVNYKLFAFVDRWNIERFNYTITEGVRGGR